MLSILQIVVNMLSLGVSTFELEDCCKYVVMTTTDTICLVHYCNSKPPRPTQMM